MSRVILSKYPDGSHHVIVGWDHTVGGAYWQEWATKDEIHGAEVWMEDNCDNADEYGSRKYQMMEQIAETGVKLEGGMWPGIALHKLRSEMPEDLRYLITDDVLTLLEHHKENPDSGYAGNPRSIIDWSGKALAPFSIQLSHDERVSIAKMILKHVESNMGEKYSLGK